MELLEKLTQTPSVPGREGRIREVIANYVQEHGLVDELKTDAMGSLIGLAQAAASWIRLRPVRRPESCSRPIWTRSAFLVSYRQRRRISCESTPSGGFDMRNLFARRVKVCTAEGDLPGVMNPAGKPIHIASDEDRKKVPEITEFFIDLGMPGPAVKERVKIGDMVVLEGPFAEVGDSVTSQCLDNRVGCWAQIALGATCTAQLRDSRRMDRAGGGRPEGRAASRLSCSAGYRHFVRHDIMLQDSRRSRGATDHRAGRRRLPKGDGFVDDRRHRAVGGDRGRRARKRISAASEVSCPAEDKTEP